MSKNFADLLSQVKNLEKQKLAVAVAQDAPVLEAVREAHRMGIIDAILVGDEDQIRAIGAELDMRLDEYEIVDVRDVVHDPKSREALITCDVAILVEQKGVTRYSDMKEEVTFLYNAEKEIAGVVIL